MASASGMTSHTSRDGVSPPSSVNARGRNDSSLAILGSMLRNGGCTGVPRAAILGVCPGIVRGHDVSARAARHSRASPGPIDRRSWLPTAFPPA